MPPLFFGPWSFIVCPAFPLLAFVVRAGALPIFYERADCIRFFRSANREGLRGSHHFRRSAIGNEEASTHLPHNPIGLTVVTLLKREGTSLHVAGIDMLDGTPVLDIKPYLSSVPPDQLRRGWMEAAEARRQAGSAANQ